MSAQDGQEDEPAALQLPPVHGAHLVALAREKFPAGQSEHAAESGADEKEPAAQTAQLVPVAYVPGTHEHLSVLPVPVAEKPAAQPQFVGEFAAVPALEVALPGHREQPGPAGSKKKLAAQAEHAAPAVGVQSPAGQGRQPVAFAGEVEPRGHCAHLGEFALVEKVPATHTEQDVSEADDPAGHEHASEFAYPVGVNPALQLQFAGEAGAVPAGEVELPGQDMHRDDAMS